MVAPRRSTSSRSSSSATTRTGPGGTSGTCKGCGSSTRKVSRPGPRCATCHREARKGSSDRRRLLYVAKQYNLTPEQYQALVDLTGGLCYVCMRNKGRCVDHDHACCPGKISCGKCVRGLACNPCNKGVLGHLRDSVESLQRAIEYIKNPPAYRIIPR